MPPLVKRGYSYLQDYYTSCIIIDWRGTLGIKWKNEELMR
jgi:hypothetical protein